MLAVYTGGTFDLFHAGHAEFLGRCAKLGSVTVALNTDEFITRYKGKPPVVPYEERKYILNSIRHVDEVIKNVGGADSKPSILSAAPDIIAIGSDWFRGGEDNYLKQMGFTWDWLREQSIVLTFIPRVIQISSTEIKARLS